MTSPNNKRGRDTRTVRVLKTVQRGNAIAYRFLPG